MNGVGTASLLVQVPWKPREAFPPSAIVLYRSPNLTNVFVQSYYGMYNYSELGLN